jgi:7,8-dihydro-6-hydroxymethylpterin dimethyltransferase
MKTKSTCPTCKKVIEAEKIVEGQYVYMTKTCPEHGDFKILLSKDKKRFLETPFTSAGKKVHEFQTDCDKGCPHDCGFCPEHNQHLCSVLIEITGRCNLRCPICYFGDFEQTDISVDEFKARLDTAMRAEAGELDVLQISGGEPTLHPQFCEILEEACSQNIKRVVINTNGLSLMEDEKVYNYVKKLKDRCEIYLQFDGWNEKANTFLRGSNLANKKEEIVNKLNKDDIKICLAVTVLKDNLEELPKILKYACDVRNITGITYQRFTKTGDGAKQTQEDSLVQEDLLYAIETKGYIKYKDLVPLPCSHENCTSIGFVFVVDKKIYSIADFIDYEEHKDIIKDKIAFESGILEYLEKQLNCSCCCSVLKNKLPIVEKLKEFTKGESSIYKDMKVLRIVVKNFQDAYTFDTDRAKKCCIGVSIGNNKIIPFCVNNIFRGNY